LITPLSMAKKRLIEIHPPSLKIPVEALFRRLHAYRFLSLRLCVSAVHNSFFASPGGQPSVDAVIRRRRLEFRRYQPQRRRDAEAQRRKRRKRRLLIDNAFVATMKKVSDVHPPSLKMPAEALFRRRHAYRRPLSASRRFIFPSLLRQAGNLRWTLQFTETGWRSNEVNRRDAETQREKQETHFGPT
jgi:hypothetical protein